MTVPGGTNGDGTSEQAAQETGATAAPAVESAANAPAQQQASTAGDRVDAGNADWAASVNARFDALDNQVKDGFSWLRDQLTSQPTKETSETNTPVAEPASSSADSADLAVVDQTTAAAPTRATGRVRIDGRKVLRRLFGAE